MKNHKITNKVILFDAENFIEVQLGFFRLTEFYEGEAKHIKGKVFKSIEDLMETYAKHGSPTKKTYSWFTDWSGYNVPGHIVRKFFKSHKSLNKHEQYIKDTLNSLLKSNDKFYIIGCKSKVRRVIEHEVAHGLYLTDKEYYKEVHKILNKYPKQVKDKIRKVLITWGYPSNNPKILIDELHAYTGTEDLLGLIDNLKLNYKDIKYIIPMQEYVLKKIRKLLKDKYFISQGE